MNKDKQNASQEPFEAKRAYTAPKLVTITGKDCENATDPGGFELVNFPPGPPGSMVGPTFGGPVS